MSGGRPPRTQKWWYGVGGAVFVLAVLSAIFGATTAGAAQRAWQVAAPLLGIAAGAWVTDLYFHLDAYKKLQRDVQMAAYQTYTMNQGVFEVWTLLARASNALHEGHTQVAWREVESSLTAAGFTLRQVQHSLREWRQLSDSAVQAALAAFEQDMAQIGERQDDMRPQIVPGNEGGGPQQ